MPTMLLVMYNALSTLKGREIEAEERNWESSMNLSTLLIRSCLNYFASV